MAEGTDVEMEDIITNVFREWMEISVMMFYLLIQGEVA